MSSATEGRRRRLSVDSRREELLDVAHDLFARLPAEEVNANVVAARAGTSRALVYHYFGGMHELYLASVRRTADELIERLRQPMEGSLREQLAEGLRRYFEFAEQHRAGLISLLRGGTTRTSTGTADIVEGVRAILLTQLIDATGISAASPVLRMTLHGWMASVETALLDWMTSDEPDREVVERMLTGQLAGMLAAASPLDEQVAGLLH